MTDPLVEFNLARIAENEAPNLAWFAPEPEDPAEWTEWFDARAESWHTRRCGSRLSEGIIKDCECGLPARVLAECEAKREIVEEYQETGAADPSDISARVAHFAFRIMLCLLTVIYADHPDYQPEWAE